MSDLLNELLQLKGYSYKIWEYHVTHSLLIIRAIRKDKREHNVHITFVEVSYLQLPISWEGNFQLGSDQEFDEVVKHTDLEDLSIIKTERVSGLKRIFSINLYKINTQKSSFYLIGKLHNIEYDVHPLY